MRTSIHPDHAMLLVGVDRFMNRDQLVRDRIALFPNPCPERAAMDVGNDVHLAFVFRSDKREDL
jgi:hypothetical protein